eukprot:CAMPEP_0185725806 /NCGR_PEP_ID=MMETSP1171-20130828/1972_1 /TAXON_ID=374046 /ORGANISM="Helicotheca tamensis, Strain CCMP826" /LENGTH=89 /DNA_ID=CAMNT_0028394025 /DNA_START=58 /DNA_END=327 /DNA_ORIENTATION=-
MASIIEKMITPSFYSQKASGLLASAGAYYKPMFRSGSVTPLWHFMAITSVVMYTANYTFHKGKGVQAARNEQKLALQEYYEKHGHSGHH